MADRTEAQRDIGQLLARVALRDQAAFKQLYDATVRCLLAIAVRLLRDPAWAEEVVQEAYVGIWNSAPNYSPAKAQPMTWLMTIARSLVVLRSASMALLRAIVISQVIGCAFAGE